MTWGIYFALKVERSDRDAFSILGADVVLHFGDTNAFFPHFPQLIIGATLNVESTMVFTYIMGELEQVVLNELGRLAVLDICEKLSFFPKQSCVIKMH